MDDFITQLNSFKQEFSLFQLQVLKRFDALEKRPDLRQDIISINDKLNAYNTVFANHSNQLKDLKAGLDFIDTRLDNLEGKMQNLKPTISLWPWK